MFDTRDPDELARLLGRVDGLQAKTWAEAPAGAKDNAPLMALVLPPLNDVIDLHTTHLAQIRRHLPWAIMIVLLSTAALSLVLVGPRQGLIQVSYQPLIDALAAMK